MSGTPIQVAQPAGPQFGAIQGTLPQGTLAADGKGSMIDIANRQMGMSEGAQNFNMWGAAAGAAIDLTKSIFSYWLNDKAMGNAFAAMNREYDLRGRMVDLQFGMLTLKKLEITETASVIKETRKLDKEEKVAIAKIKAEAAVDIAKTQINPFVSNPQPQAFYGSPQYS